MVKGGAYITNLDQYESVGTHWITLNVNAKNVTYFDSFGVEHIPREIRKFIRNKNIITNIYRLQAYDSIMCGYFCIGFIDFMLKDKSLLEYANLFSPNEHQKKDKIILKYFLQNLNNLKFIIIFAINIEKNFKKQNNIYF